MLTKGAWTPAPPGTYSSGGGGGTSQLFTQPWYQAGNVPASISEYYSSTPMRAVPDIAMDADPNTGMIVGETQVFPDGTYWDQYRIGGTSLSSPLVSAIIADRDSLHGNRAGNINPTLYREYQIAPSLFFHDVTGAGHIATNNGLYPAVPGFDLATGIGTIKMAPFIVGSF